MFFFKKARAVMLGFPIFEEGQTQLFQQYCIKLPWI